MKITLESQLRAWLFHIIGTSMMLGCLIYLGFEPISTMVFVITWVVYTVPTLIIYIEYLSKNNGQEIEVERDEIIVKYKNGEVKIYKITDLKKITVYKSASLDKGGIPILPTESFYYARIEPKEGEDIIITCLMAYDVDVIIRRLSGVPYERRKTGFAFISLR
jgi:hypothetical protein